MGRVVVITGASRGLGLAMVEHFLAMGDSVFGLSRGMSDLQHPHYRHHEVDVTDEGAIACFFRELKGQASHLDVLINNAGIASMNAFAITPPDTSERIFNVNVHGTAVCCQRALSLLKRSASPRIINFTTVAVPLLLEGEAVYAASKSAVETLTKILAKEYGHFGITCNAVGPSPIATALIQSVPKDKIDRLIRQQAVKRMAEATDVLNVVDFFAKPESHMITGQLLYLGGVSQ